MFSKKNKFSNKLQEDIIKIKGRKIFLNPFLYRRRIDKNTYKWLTSYGQFSELKILSNRKRFYSQLEWNTLTEKQKNIKDLTIEIFLKTIYIISNFHPDLNSAQILEVEKKLIENKKISFEKLAENIIKQKAYLNLREKRKFKRQLLINNFNKWFSLKETQKAIVPIFVIIFLSALLGWSAGISKNSCNPYFEPIIDNQL